MASRAQQPLLSTGVKAHATKNPAYITPMSDNLRVFTDNEYPGLGIIDIDVTIGADDDKRVVLSGLCELKEKLLDLNGKVINEQPHQEAFQLWLARTAKIAMYRDLISAPTSLSQVTAIEIDPATGMLRALQSNNAWKRQLQNVAGAALPDGTLFVANSTMRIYAVYACDVRGVTVDPNFDVAIRNFAVLGFIVETVGNLIPNGTTNRDMRICQALCGAIAPIQCVAPIVVLAQATNPAGPWALDVCDAQGWTVHSAVVPQLPVDPDKHRYDPRIGEWQRTWADVFRLGATYAKLRDQIIHRSLREDGARYCLSCEDGTCRTSGARHVLQ